MASSGNIEIVDYDPRWRADFARLNLEWLERWFTVEPIDREVLGDPDTHLLAGRNPRHPQVQPTQARD